MPNRNYLNGVYKERKFVNEAKAKGKPAFRSAGSKGKIDVVIIDTKKLEITFIQCKPKKMSQNAKNKIAKDCQKLNNEYLCRFEVR